ncbi:MAG: hypothetical protein FWF51_03735 [Chitinivibrionia bacterium]|nr:hypothetical protein [Chitinivibrionia bacterium]
MKIDKIIAILIFAWFAVCAQIPFGGFSNFKAFRDNIPDVTDTSFRLSKIEKSVDKNDLDFRLEYRDERGKMKLTRKEIAIFADGKNYYIADGTIGFGSPRFRKLTDCKNFSYFRRVSSAPSGTGGHSKDNLNETWVILDHTNGAISELTDKVLKQILLRNEPLLYNEYADKHKKNGSPMDYIKRICKD